MNTEGIALSSASGSESESIRQLISENSNKARILMQQRLEATREAERKVMREQIEALSFQSERAMANELSNRTLSKMFGSFSLIQKIIQNMG